MRLRSDDAELACEVTGSGPDVVLLHPFPCSRGFWRPVVERLESRFRVTTYDLRGLGESETGQGVATMARHAEDLERLCVEMKITRAVFAGCSIGGYILFEYWRRHRERFRGLVLCDTKALADDEAARQGRELAASDVLLRGPESFLQKSLPNLVGASTQRNRPDVFEAARRLCSASTAPGIAAVQRGMALRPDSTRELPQIDVPCLVLCGEEDLPTPPPVMEAMARQISGAKFQVLPSAGHFAAFEQPEESARILRQFLEPLPRL